MENNQTISVDTSAVETQHNLSSSCPPINSQGNMFSGVLASMHGPYLGVDDNSNFFGYGVGFPGQAELPKPSLLAGDLRNGFLGLISEMERSSMEAKMGFGLHNGSFQQPNWICQNPPQKVVKKALGKRKRPAEEPTKQKKPRQTGTKLISMSNGPGSLTEGPQKSATKSSNLLKETSMKSKEKKETQIETKLVPGKALNVDDINKEEAAQEYRQCVSLLEKYGVLRTHEFYSSQNYPPCAPHPGYVGDGLVSRHCKVCKAIEDPKNTIICDECQEVFHIPCCLPRVNSKHFDREDDWYCPTCRKLKKKTGRLNSFQLCENGFVDECGNVYPCKATYSSRVRLGPAHQADIPLWMGKAADEDPLNVSGERPGIESPLSKEQKEGERDRISKAFQHSSNWLPAKSLPSGTPENWIQCQSVLVKAFKGQNGHKHREVICGKWRRAPMNVQQTDHWECFCVIEWDPLHADCSVPQELPTEEIQRRMAAKSQPDTQPCHEVSDKKGMSEV